MGSARLRELAAVREVGYDEVAGSVVAVDAHNWLHRYLATTVQFTDPATYTTADGTEVPNVLGVVRGLPKLENELLPAFVFDGRVVERKRPEMAARRERRESTLSRARAHSVRADAVRASGRAGCGRARARRGVRARKLDARAQRLTPVIGETTRELLALLDVSVVEAPAEGETQAAHVARRGDAGGVGDTRGRGGDGLRAAGSVYAAVCLTVRERPKASTPPSVQPRARRHRRPAGPAEGGRLQS